jgi:DNA primase
MLDILSYLPPKRKKTSSGWISFNAVCCSHNGETFDKRGRGGVMIDSTTDWHYHCFNCGYKAGFTLGRPVTIKARRLLGWLGVSSIDIDWLNLESLKHKSITDILDDRTVSRKKITFKEVMLPEEARAITQHDKKFVNYLEGRGLKYNEYPFMITPKGKARYKNRIIIPYTNDNKIVGYTSRFLDDRLPKYLNEQQPGYVFGLDLQKENWQFAVVTEGILDAISINGLAVLHNEISNDQAEQLKQLYKEVIVVPDQDKAGLKLVEKAIEHGFNVSIPKWGNKVKDVNDAVQKYGKIATMLSIVSNKQSGFKAEVATKFNKKFK